MILKSKKTCFFLLRALNLLLGFPNIKYPPNNKNYLRRLLFFLEVNIRGKGLFFWGISQSSGNLWTTDQISKFLSSKICPVQPQRLPKSWRHFKQSTNLSGVRSRSAKEFAAAVFATETSQTKMVVSYGYWLAVSTPLKNISQLGWLFPIYRK